ncbi:Gfo/Idh/MocA family protein [Terriglobus aquaticus]|uniref:Gfo/Idh/MocA family protein n=1 Tax=Terriglobus aquaticus TaxID=940139 RepID=A0ABW9KLB4_9BACT|nr:Gfo/Idh/MocA family oxidoreductase [Terriglobus aquaticus]
MKMSFSRRRFLSTFPIATAATLPATHRLLAATQTAPARQRGPNDQIQFALVGAGIRGQQIASAALQTPNVKIVAVADCYDGRQRRSKELWGQDVFTTRDYREILARPDVDAVIVATPDHWHKQASIDAMHAGKDVYLEKPMIHLYADGPEIIAAAQRTNRILQVGSQRVSNALYRKAKELLASGAIGKLNLVAARWDRSSSLGAWNYSVPPDASPETCDWPRFLGSAPKIPWNAERFFQWRKWTDYGSGVAGDLFVHLFSGTHFITGAHGPTRAYATGAIRYWNDGRNVPDVMLALFDYPEGFNLSLRVNQISGGEEAESFLFTGSEGTLEIASSGLTLHRVPMQKDPGYMVNTFAKAEQQAYIQQYEAKYPPNPPGTLSDEKTERYQNPRGYDDTVEHFRNFFESVRSRTQPVEDATFGFRAAGAALLSNVSLQRDSVVHWNPETMKLS